jgi:hypothetical protein
MFWDVAFIALGSATQLAMAYLGWHVSAPKHKRLSYLFLALGVLGVFLTILMSYRASVSQKEVVEQITGGDSYAWVMAAPTTVLPDAQFPLTVLAEGKYPVYDVTLRVMRIIRREGQPDEAEFREVAVGNVTTNATKFVDGLLPPIQGQLNEYRIEILARNGRTFEVIKIDTSKGWSMHGEVTRDDKTLKTF